MPNGRTAGRIRNQNCNLWRSGALCCNAPSFFQHRTASFMSNTRLKLMEAIARQKTVEVSYNGKRIKLAPHLLFERRGDLFVSALNLSKNWRSDEEKRLGQFKLTGLGAPDLLEESFDPLPSYEPTALQSDDKLLLAV